VHTVRRADLAVATLQQWNLGSVKVEQQFW